MPGPPLALSGQILLALLVAAAAYFDLRFRRIPNALVIAGLLAGLLTHLAAGRLSGLGESLAGLAAGFALYFPLYLLRARGAGDVKLLAAIGAIAGPGNVFWIFLATALAGGVLALGIVVSRGRLRKTLFNISWILSDIAHFRAPHRRNPELDLAHPESLRLPHALPLAVASAIFLFAVHYRGSV